MARRKKRSKSRKHNVLRRLLRFFVPNEVRSLSGWLWFSISRVGTASATIFISLTLFFASFPVPFSAYMAQQKISALMIGKDYAIHYQWVNRSQIAWQMQMAVIAGEDQKFSSHFGLDWQAIQTAFKQNSKNKQLRGASTISQQTVKNLFLWHGSHWIRKGIEVPLTLLVEQLWDKTRILEVYLNIAEFGEGIFGVEAAAQHFFKKSAAQLTLQESALLAASLPNPQIFRVDKPNALMRKRQTWIIQQMQNLGGKQYLNKLEG